jgi:hypothetical protein
MATVVNSFDWNYVAAINEEGNLGGIETFKMLAKKRSKSNRFWKINCSQ